MNYFELLNMPVIYDLNAENLTKHYLDQQKKYHPDMARNLEDKEYFLNISTQVNVAYRVLKDDFSRSEYILSLEGLNIDNYILDPEILVEIWQELELLDNEDQLHNLQALLEEKILKNNELIELIKTAFDELNFNNMLFATVMLKYNKNIIEKIKNKIKNANNRNH